MAAQVICHGIDELMLETGFTSDQASTISDVRVRVQEALGASGTRPLFLETTLKAGSWTLRIPSVELRVHPRGNRRFIVHAWIHPEALHADPAGVYQSAWTALDTIRRLYLPPGAQPAPISLHSLALHADVVGWNYAPSTAARVLFRPRRHLDGHMTAGRWTGSVFGRRLDIYDKQAELEQEPRKAWIRDYWPSGISRVVWRIEPRWDSGALARRPAPVTFDDLWRERLSEIRLVRRPKGAKGDPNYRWPTDPVWRMLEALHFVEPWTVAPPPPRRNTASIAQRRALNLARLLRSLAAVVGLEGRAPIDFPAMAREIVAAAVLARPALATDLEGWATQAAQRAGLGGLAEPSDEGLGCDDGDFDWPDEDTAA